MGCVMLEAPPPGNRLKSAHAALVRILEAPPPASAPPQSVTSPDNAEENSAPKRKSTDERAGPANKKQRDDAGGDAAEYCECDVTDDVIEPDSGCEGHDEGSDVKFFFF